MSSSLQVLQDVQSGGGYIFTIPPTIRDISASLAPSVPSWNTQKPVLLFSGPANIVFQ